MEPTYTVVTSYLIDWFWILIFPANLVRGFSNKAMKFQNNAAILVQITMWLICQPRNQNQSIGEGHKWW